MPRAKIQKVILKDTNLPNDVSDDDQLKKSETNDRSHAVYLGQPDC